MYVHSLSYWNRHFSCILFINTSNASFFIASLITGGNSLGIIKSSPALCSLHLRAMQGLFLPQTVHFFNSVPAEQDVRHKSVQLYITKSPAWELVTIVALHIRLSTLVKIAFSFNDHFGFALVLYISEAESRSRQMMTSLPHCFPFPIHLCFEQHTLHPLPHAARLRFQLLVCLPSVYHKHLCSLDVCVFLHVWLQR